MDRKSRRWLPELVLGDQASICSSQEIVDTLIRRQMGLNLQIALGLLLKDLFKMLMGGHSTVRSIVTRNS